jgi:hypothetical protein
MQQKISQNDFEKLILETINKNSHYQQQIEALNSFGFIYKNVDINIELQANNSYQVEFLCEEPYLNQKLRDRYNLSFIEMNYDKDKMQIEITRIFHNEYITNKEKLKKKLEEESSELVELAKFAGDTITGVPISKFIDDIEDKVEELYETNIKELMRIKSEIEITINSMLANLKSDIKDILTKIDLIIQDYDTSLENNENIYELLKEFKNHRAKKWTIRQFINDYIFLMNQKRLKIYRINKDISAINLSHKNLKLEQTIAEYKIYLTKKSLAQQELDNLKKNKQASYNKIEEIVEEYYQEYLIDLLQENQAIEDIEINHKELLRYCLPEYNKYINTLNIEV